MEDNIAAEVYSTNGEIIKKFKTPYGFSNDKGEEKELFKYYKGEVESDKNIDINEVDKIVCHSFVNPTKTIIFKRDKSEWKKEIKDN